MFTLEERDNHRLSVVVVPGGAYAVEEICWPSTHDEREEDEGDDLVPHAISVLFDDITDRPRTKRSPLNCLDGLKHS